MSVGWGIVGTGGIARRMAQALDAAAGAELVAVCGRTSEKAQEIAPGRAAYGDYDAFLADPAVDAVYIGTPTDLHAEQAIAAAEAEKHVLVEKPMALSVADAEAMASAAERAGVRLGVGFHLRQHPVHVAIRERLAAGALGEVVLVQALWGFYSADWPRGSWKMDPARAGAGSLAGLGVHLIDLLRFLVGREVVEVSALMDGAEQGFPVEFLTVASLRFEGGALGSLISSRRLRQTEDDVTVYCDGGRLRGAGSLGTEPVGTLEIRTDEGSEILEPPLADLYTLEAEACTAALAEGRELPAPAADGIASVAITSALLESGRTGCAIRL